MPFLQINTEINYKGFQRMVAYGSTAACRNPQLSVLSLGLFVNYINDIDETTDQLLM